MTNIIIYIGGFRFPDSASALRAMENAKLFRKLNYEVIFIGKIKENYSNAVHSPQNFCGFPVYITNSQKDGNSFSFPVNIVNNIVREKGKQRIKAIIAYNYDPIRFFYLLKYTKRNGIPLIADNTEWYGIDGKVTLQKIIRFILTEWRMRILTPKAKNVITAVQKLSLYYNKANTLVLPFVLVNEQPAVIENYYTKETQKIKFTYSGNPGENLSKDYLDICIICFSKIAHINHNFEFNILGITKEKFLEYRPNLDKHLETLEGKVNFKGKLSHSESIKYLIASDFIFFIRPNNRVSNIGFPTKVFEAFRYGIPAITNDTSDLSKFIKNNINGFLIEKPDIDSIVNTLKFVLNISRNELNILKNNCRNYNPFRYQNFLLNTSNFFNQLRK